MLREVRREPRGKIVRRREGERVTIANEIHVWIRRIKRNGVIELQIDAPQSVLIDEMAPPAPEQIEEFDAAPLPLGALPAMIPAKVAPALAG